MGGLGLGGCGHSNSDFSTTAADGDGAQRAPGGKGPDLKIDTTAAETAKAPKPGANAQHQGAFTVWTEPAQPAVGEDYRLIAQIELPHETTNYRYTDITGEVRQNGAVLLWITDTSTRPDQFRLNGYKGTLTVQLKGTTEAVTHAIWMRSHMLDETDAFTLEIKPKKSAKSK
jgi:hypothetical protein